MPGSVSIRGLRADEVGAADRIFRLAFGTQFGIPDPIVNFPDLELVGPRFRMDPGSFFAAELDGVLVGSNFAAHWGSVGYFGPLTVHPDHWDKKIGSLLVEPVLERFDQWGTTLSGLFTFANSGKHVGLYAKFGFWPRFLTPVMVAPARPAPRPLEWAKLSDCPPAEREGFIADCRAITDEVYDGLDVSREIVAVLDQRLGDTLLLWDGGRPVGFAVCHVGGLPHGRSEAVSGTCLAKFAAVRPGPKASEHFDRLLDMCEAFTWEQGRREFSAGVNTGREDAYARMRARGYRTGRLQGVIMHRPNQPGYNRPCVYVLDDWR
jgi:GNAT superfamily N-acetyltransferase